MLTRLRRFARASLRGGLACFLAFPLLLFLWRQAAIAARSLHLTNSPSFELTASLPRESIFPILDRLSDGQPLRSRKPIASPSPFPWKPVPIRGPLIPAP